MASAKGETIIIPLRAALPVGAVFKFDGLRTRYEVVASPDEWLACKYCAFRRKAKRTYCDSMSCTPSKREDGRFVYVRVARTRGQ